MKQRSHIHKTSQHRRGLREACEKLQWSKTLYETKTTKQLQKKANEKSGTKLCKKNDVAN
jgi:hypothetical protein